MKRAERVLTTPAGPHPNGTLSKREHVVVTPHRTPQRHGLSYGKNRHPLYNTWLQMKARCYRSNHPAYDWYGGCGITVCDRWRNSFTAFLADVGERPSVGHSLDRVETFGNYEPGNVRWATKAEQQRNRADNRNLTHNGRTMCPVDWAAELGMSLSTLRNRINSGWSVSDALTRPVKRP